MTAASGLLVAAGAWQPGDQRAFDQSGTQIRRAFGMSLDELAFEILAFLDETESYRPVSSAARQAWIDGVPDDELRDIDAAQEAGDVGWGDVG